MSIVNEIKDLYSRGVVEFNLIGQDLAAYGINDSREVKDDFSQKRLIQKLEPGEEFVFPWSAEIIE